MICRVWSDCTAVSAAGGKSDAGPGSGQGVRQVVPCSASPLRTRPPPRTLMEASHDLVLPSPYTEDLLAQPFLLPDTAAVPFAVTSEDAEEFPVPASAPFTVSLYPEAAPAPAPYWEHCAASLEEVQSAIFSSAATAAPPPAVVAVQRLDTRTDVMTISLGEAEVSSSDTPATRRQKGGRRAKKKSSYKHVPHSEKPAHLVEKRNARERRRVEAVNTAFLRLRRAVPQDNKRGKRVSKVKILSRAIDYILNMQEAIDQHDGVTSSLVYDDRDDDHLFAF